MAIDHENSAWPTKIEINQFFKWNRWKMCRNVTVQKLFSRSPCDNTKSVSFESTLVCSVRASDRCAGRFVVGIVLSTENGNERNIIKWQIYMEMASSEPSSSGRIIACIRKYRNRFCMSGSFVIEKELDLLSIRRHVVLHASVAPYESLATEYMHASRTVKYASSSSDSKSMRTVKRIAKPKQ